MLHDKKRKKKTTLLGLSDDRREKTLGTMSKRIAEKKRDLVTET